MVFIHDARNAFYFKFYISVLCIIKPQNITQATATTALYTNTKLFRSIKILLAH